MILKNLQDQGSSWASEVICCYSVVSRVTVRIYNNLMSKYLNWIFLPLAWQLLSIIPYLTSEYKMTIILKTLEINTAVILVSCNTFTTYLPSCNSLHPNISLHILHTFLDTFPKVLTRRICFPIIRFLPWWPFPLCDFRSDIVRRN